ncbi:DUF421 domain-containing protein [Dyadobacter fermentans]|uniref:YetF C-terminal domain-containing protein n=1 Tax=Dyadobacter fermentans (strain ATCC 700827 / DSM 18053 / CIP 107007 / KCTC 52180 / NS114) TaxID=471854 RepID=C6VVC8_DYAFD|nr:YetF domain-containing protein [Dyadobacter fermentans]ACT96658.1 protein of unknown function DUF421 [Dyadobacter fermentans DSM 18053]
MDFKTIFINDLDWQGALTIVVKTAIMFLMVLLFLRLSGKKGVRELTFFEVAIIISLGSAAGDPMLMEDSAIVPSIIVFAVIIIIYRLLTSIAARSEKFEMILEGGPFYIIEDGMFTLEEERDNNFAKDEFFSELRSRDVEHIGQVETAILETSGMLSVYFYPDDQLRKGLPIKPKPYNKKSIKISTPGDYACTTCANVQELSDSQQCDRCGEKEWVFEISTLRVG